MGETIITHFILSDNMRIKKHHILVTFLLILLIFGIGCIDGNHSIQQINGSVIDNISSNNSQQIDLVNATSIDSYDIAIANNAFAFEMYHQVVDDQNVVFSPYSIFTAMSVCYEGAGGSTKKQIAKAFNYPLNISILENHSKSLMNTINSNSSQYDLKIANALWIQKGYLLNPKYVSNSRNYYNGNITSLDFGNQSSQSKDIINNWVEEKTGHKIRNMLSNRSITTNTSMIITNAVYFKANWSNEFDPQDTQEEAFYYSKGDVKTISMMHSMMVFSYGENDDAQILSMPYCGNNLSMYIVLPKNNDIKSFENHFTLSEYNNMKMTLSSESKIDFWLPKFKFDTNIQLSEPFYNMGIVDAFQNYANFSNMYDSQKVQSESPLVLDEVIHKSFIDVEEKGTEASAATVSRYVNSAPPETEIVEFRADHPFMFFIEDNRNGCILFMGKIESPDY